MTTALGARIGPKERGLGMTASVLRRPVRRNQGLAQTEAAVAAWHFGMGENLQAFAFEPALQVFKQKNILEGPAAQTNILKAGL